MNPIIPTAFFACAVLHTFSVSIFRKVARGFPTRSMRHRFFHVMGEVEAVFGIWALALLSALSSTEGGISTWNLVKNMSFIEPAFVVTIMIISASKPVLEFASGLINEFSKLLPLDRTKGFYFSSLLIGPLLGSLITEPAAMTVTALLLRDRIFKETVPSRDRYLTLAILFVNVSIGGVLTHFAAPPVVMVSRVWEWDSAFMFAHFGWKAALAVLLNAILGLVLCGKHLPALQEEPQSRTPIWIRLMHLAFIGAVVLNSHHLEIFLPLLLLFLIFVKLTDQHQSPLQIKAAIGVGCFLAGLVILGSFQSWWLGPLIAQLTPFSLFLGSTTLTAITDNAALTYLGAQIPELSFSIKYALVSGAIAGGGLTVIANAPNPAGYAILSDQFGSDGIRPFCLFLGALLPTLIAMTCLWLLPL